MDQRLTLAVQTVDWVQYPQPTVTAVSSSTTAAAAAITTSSHHRATRAGPRPAAGNNATLDIDDLFSSCFVFPFLSPHLVFVSFDGTSNPPARCSTSRRSPSTAAVSPGMSHYARSEPCPELDGISVQRRENSFVGQDIQRPRLWRFMTNLAMRMQVTAARLQLKEEGRLWLPPG